jgi:ethanolamine utilization protein EutN
MQIALVIGHTHSTIKHPSLDGQKLLIAQPLMADGQSPDGGPVIAVDRSGAGPNDRVILSTDGTAIRDVFGLENSPIRWSVLGIVD